jgi:hypothetical protein
MSEIRTLRQFIGPARNRTAFADLLRLNLLGITYNILCARDPSKFSKEDQVMKLLALPALLLFAVLPASADSFNVFLFNGQNQQTIQLTPTGNPLYHSGGPPFEIDVEVPSFISSVSDPIVSVAITLGGQSLPFFQVDLDNCLAGEDCGFGVAMVTPFFATPVSSVVTVTINDQSETFNFRYSNALTPEPNTLLLLGTGVAIIGWRKYNAIRRANS